MEDFLYSSARIRALENGICTKDRLERLMESGSYDRAISLLSEYGVSLQKNEDGTFSREKTLEFRLKEAFREVMESAPEADFATLWLYPYDCNNIKAVIKCAHRGIDAEEMLFDFGTLSCQTVKKAILEKNYELLGNFSNAAKEAMEAFATSGNPQSVDLILDAACYALMKSKAEESKNEFAYTLVVAKIDFINIIMCIRLLRMGNYDMGKGMLSNAFLSGGSLDKKMLLSLYETGEQTLWEKLAYGKYQKFATECNINSSLSEIEKSADNSFLEEVAKAKMIPYGAETLVAYLLKVENEVRNLRIILAGLQAKLPIKTVKERIRFSNV